MEENSLLENIDDLKEKLVQAKRELAVLYEISNAMRTTLELNHILYIILTGVTSHIGLGFNRAILFLVNPKSRLLEPKIAIGPESGEHAQKIWGFISQSHHLDDLIKKDRLDQNAKQSALFKAIKDLKIPLDNQSSLLSDAYHRGQPMHIPQSKIITYIDDPLLKKFATNELVIMPLKAKDKVNGLIVADNLFTRKSITEEDMKIFMMLANQAGLAIENSHLYEIVMHKSHSDSITGLWNHGFFQSRLSIEINAHKRNSAPLSLVMIDIDNFKQLNDQFGHQNGDIVLKDIAQVLKESSRETDYVCRYGGEEFSVILTTTNKEQAYTIAERVRQNIADYQFTGFKPHQAIRITVSIGIATFPDDTQTKEELISLADKAMYEAKFSGKNQTCQI